MKKVSLLLVLGLCSALYAQYIPMLAAPATWQVFGKDPQAALGYNSTLWRTTDYTVGSYTYKQIHEEMQSGGQVAVLDWYLREDSTGKVFRYEPFMSNDAGVLLYDFGAEIGDSIEIPMGLYAVNLHLDSIKTVADLPLSQWNNVLVNAILWQNARVFFLSSTLTYHPIIWIEGVGSLAGPMASTRAWIPEANLSNEPILACYDAGLGAPIGYSLENGQIQNCKGPSVVGIDSNDKPNITLYPNPTSEILQVSGSTESAAYEILSIEGKVLQKGYTQNAQINVQKLAAGVYFLSLQTGSNHHFTSKFTKN